MIQGERTGHSPTHRFRQDIKIAEIFVADGTEEALLAEITFTRGAVRVVLLLATPYTGTISSFGTVPLADV